MSQKYVSNMERFTLCNEIIPKILFTSMTDWEESKNKLYIEIQNWINKWIVLDESEYRCMSYMGITPRQIINIAGAIENGLTILTNNNKWSSKIAWEIIYGIEGFINGLINSKNWEKIYNLLSAQDLANMIYKNIEWQLDNGEHYPCILEDIRIFKCINCEKIDDYINDSGLCMTCEEEEENGFPSLP